ncbi:MAG: DUF3368 domain-containing protein, partial [Pyrinomonadaceae bacterium]
MIAVSDTSPLNYLVLIGYIDVLSELYSRVLIPQSVYEELNAQKTPARVRDWRENPPSWIEVSCEQLRPDVSMHHLHAGERDAIALALQVEAEVLIIDERQGREEAEKAELNVIGTIGVLGA